MCPIAISQVWTRARQPALTRLFSGQGFATSNHFLVDLGRCVARSGQHNPNVAVCDPQAGRAEVSKFGSLGLERQKCAEAPDSPSFRHYVLPGKGKALPPLGAGRRAFGA